LFVLILFQLKHSGARFEPNNTELVMTRMYSTAYKVMAERQKPMLVCCASMNRWLIYGWSRTLWLLSSRAGND